MTKLELIRALQIDTLPMSAEVLIEGRPAWVKLPVTELHTIEASSDRGDGCYYETNLTSNARPNCVVLK